MKQLVRILLLYIFVLISFGFSGLDNNMEKKEPKFLDDVSSKNPEAQLKINKLKKDFYNEREKLNNSYEKKIKLMKKSRRNELSDLKKKYKKKLRKLRKKYSDIPDIKIDSKPRPKLSPPNPAKVSKRAKLRDKNKKQTQTKNRLKKTSPVQNKDN